MTQAEPTFAEKIRTIGVVGLSSSPKRKHAVDDHGTHRVVTTEHNTKDDRVDVTVMPATVRKGKG